MKISVAWLKEYLNLPGTFDVQELATKLTFSGLEVEGVTSLAKGFEKVVVGQILERNQHPNADRLSLTKIDVGGPAPLEIVCGAQNIKPGQKIPVAVMGAVIPNGLEIKAAKIRGVPSQGMLCSLDELLLPKEWQAEDGIFILPPDTKVGTPVAEVLGRDDTILEINVTPNRGDVLSHIGVAREVAALFGVTVKNPETKVTAVDGGPKVTIKNAAGKDLCPRYFGRMITGVKVGESPAWLKKRVESIGLRSVNNVVDVTSFVMFEIGNPLHAFDAKKIISKSGSVDIAIAVGAAGEFEALNGKTVPVLAEDVMIQANGKNVAIAGVMGGKNSEVDDGTVDVFLEAAEFHPTRVRKTGRRLGLLTDAGYRFERGVDPSKVEWAMERATALILEVAGGKAHKRAQADVMAELEPQPQIRLRTSEIQRLLGKSPDMETIVRILRGLGITAEVSAGERDVVNVVVPRWRRDIRRSVDLIEEVARIWGFENLQAKLPLGGVGGPESVDTRRRSYFQLRRIRRHLASLGFFEALNYGFTSPEVLSKAGVGDPERWVEVANPVTSDFSVLKPLLLPGLLENAEKNFAHKKNNLRLFEARRVFQKATTASEKDARLNTGVTERSHLAVLMTGADVDEFWQGKPAPVDFYSLRGVVESAFEMLGVSGMRLEPTESAKHLHPGQSAAICLGKKEIGVIGRLHPKVEKEFGFEQDIFYAEICLDDFLSDKPTLAEFHPFSNYPLVERDFSALVKDNVNAQMLRDQVTKSAKPLLKDFYFFDVYRGARVPDGHISYAFRVVLGSDTNTLADEEIAKTQEKIMKDLENTFQAKFAGLN